MHTHDINDRTYVINNIKSVVISKVYSHKFHHRVCHPFHRNSPQILPHVKWLVEVRSAFHFTVWMNAIELESSERHKSEILISVFPSCSAKERQSFSFLWQTCAQRICLVSQNESLQVCKSLPQEAKKFSNASHFQMEKKQPANNHLPTEWKKHFKKVIGLWKQFSL